MIDLSASWTGINPVYKQLTDAPAGGVAPKLSALSGQNWVNLYSNTSYILDTKTGNWSQRITIASVNENVIGSTAADPVTNNFYVPNGYSGAGGVSMLQMNFLTNTAGSIPMDPQLTQLQTYSATWSAAIPALILVGKGTWAWNIDFGWKQVGQGKIPTGRSYSCLVPAYSGKRMILFGGYDSTITSMSDIYFLDMDFMSGTLTWTKGPDAGVPNARAGHACAVSNDYVIIWGGSRVINGALLTTSNTTLIFNMKTGNWVSEYIVPGVPIRTMTTTTTTSTATSTATSTTSSISEIFTAATSPTPTPDATASSSPSRLPLILGTVSGLCLLVGSVQGFVLYRSWRRRKNKKIAPQSKGPDAIPLPGQPPSDSASSYNFRHSPQPTNSSSHAPSTYTSRTYTTSNRNYPLPPPTIADYESSYGYTPPSSSRGYEPSYPLPPPSTSGRSSKFGYMPPPPPSTVGSYRTKCSSVKRKPRAPATIIGESEFDYPSHLGPTSDSGQKRYPSIITDSSRRTPHAMQQWRVDTPTRIKKAAQREEDYSPMHRSFDFTEEDIPKAKRNVQEGRFGARRVSQHPHTAMQGPIEGYADSAAGEEYYCPGPVSRHPHVGVHVLNGVVEGEEEKDEDEEEDDFLNAYYDPHTMPHLSSKSKNTKAGTPNYYNRRS
ncbi:hypothetical protein BC939DRAFT_475150 [Gamsiella multidivaricata]|uniref:uncharacterized protein n=1 Tax=Gamsiella multidivaricata TaxID=101098 RepID=UPI00222029F7|nr:uncharacterized protein BC939DRAFT_475150 [Gamsiella multidivaricata]KAI7827547.1 hypothetical protein BC939DRAFT_475150 [Gamsiella multidivaricata]